MFNKKQLDRVEVKLDATFELLEIFFKKLEQTKAIDQAKVIKNGKHKKHLHMKKCPDCGVEKKGNIGLAIHRSLVHGVKSGKYAPKEKIEASQKPLKRFVKCSIEGCYKDVMSKGFCSSHYQKNRYLLLKTSQPIMAN